MSDSIQNQPDPKHLENLQAVAEHIQKAKVTDPQAADKPPASSGIKQYLRRWGPLGVMLLFVFGKLKWVLMIAKFAKLQTLLTMFIAVWAYATLWGLPFAVGFVLLIFVHELGHALVLRHQGIPAGAPVFIPFVGAVIAMKGMPRNAYVEALVGIGGPALGTVGAMVCLVIAWIVNEPFWYALASTGFLLNLFNMIPISPLDGGRIAGVISQWLWVAGLALGVVILINTRSPILFIILLLGVVTLVKTVKNKNKTYYDVGLQKRAMVAVLYFGLMGLMAVGMFVAQQPLQGIQ